VRQLLVGPLFQLDVHRGVEGARVQGLGGGQVDVLDHMGGHALPQLLLQHGLPAGRGGRGLKVNKCWMKCAFKMLVLRLWNTR